MAWPAWLQALNNIPTFAHQQALNWYPRICAAVVIVCDYVLPGLLPVDFTIAAHERFLYLLDVIFGTILVLWQYGCQVASAGLVNVTNTGFYARGKLSLQQFCRYAYVFVYFLKLYTTVGQQTHPDRGNSRHWFAPGTRIRDQLMLKNHELGQTDQRLTYAYWTNKWREWYQSWNWGVIKQWLRAWFKKQRKRPKRVLAKPPPGSHLRRVSFGPSLLTTVDEQDEAAAIASNEPAVQAQQNPANGAAKNNKKKNKEKRR